MKPTANALGRAGRHAARGNWRTGLLLSSGTVALWGFLPLNLKLLIEGMDAYTITWYRMTAAAILLGLFQARRRRLPVLRGLNRTVWILLATAVAGLAGNYVLFVKSLDYISPATAELVIQLAPILFMLGGIVFFRESFNRRQWLGLALLLVGLALFFNERLVELLHVSGGYGRGVLLIVIAGVAWAAYALAQKQLLLNFEPQNILLLIYVASAVLLLPGSEPGQLLTLTTAQVVLLLLAVFNTLAAYGCFAEALEHWEASRISAVIATAPLVTIGLVYATTVFWPDVDIGRPLGWLSIFGAVVVVAGSVMAAWGDRNQEPAAGT